MFYHIKIRVTGISSWFVENKTKEEILVEYLCPFINNEVAYHNNYLRNFSSFGGMTVYETKLPVDSDWPLKKSNFLKKSIIDEFEYEKQFQKKLDELNCDVTENLYAEALNLIESGQYKEGRRKHLKKFGSNFCFFICPFGNEQVDHNYEYVIKPMIEKNQFEIKRADEISHTKLITEVIIESINRSKFLIADLSDGKPNCYYEVGYAHSQGKSVIIIAQEGTPRHFDIAAYKWIYYKDYQDLKLKLEKELEGFIKILRSE